MNFSLLLSFAPHALLEIAAACGLIYWISQTWTRTPASVLLKLVRHPAHFWIASGLAAIPSLFGATVVALVFSGGYTENVARAMVPVFYALSLVYGMLSGLAAACCAGVGERFHLRGAFVTAIALIVAPPWYMSGSQWIFQGIRIFVIVIIVAVACIVLVDKNQTPHTPGADAPPPLPATNSSPLPALLIGFTPALLILLAITLGVSGAADHMSNDASRVLLILASIASVACCIISSVMLFKRRTSAAIAGAVMLLLLNAFLSFFFGCCAALVGANFGR